VLPTAPENPFTTMAATTRRNSVFPVSGKGT
jgi:hypothetical protein